MNPEERNQFAEQLLDATLRRYSSAEPAPGLEERLLARLATVPAKPISMGHRWPWMLAAAAALVIAIVAIASLRHRPAPQVAYKHSRQAVPSVNADRPNAEHSDANHSNAAMSILQSPKAEDLAHPATQKRPATVATVTAPHQELFPTPVPPSEQERLLLSYVDRTPVPELLATNARMAAERDADLKRFFADADPATHAGDAQ